MKFESIGGRTNTVKNPGASPPTAKCPVTSVSVDPPLPVPFTSTSTSATGSTPSLTVPETMKPVASLISIPVVLPATTKGVARAGSVVLVGLA